MDMGTSPTPNAVSILNWPGPNAMGSPRAGCSARVTTSAVSWSRHTTSKTTGVYGPGRPGAGPTSARPLDIVIAVAIEVKQPEPSLLEALQDKWGDPF